MIIKYFKNIYNKYFKQKCESDIKIIETPISKGIISINEIRDILKKYCSINNIYLSDPAYLLTSKDEADKYTKQSLINTRKYVKDVHDCDNFSFALIGYWSDSLKSFCFGIAWSKSHAFNIMIDNDKQVWICEPQSNMWYKIEQIQNNKMYYPLRLILI